MSAPGPLPWDCRAESGRTQSEATTLTTSIYRVKTRMGSKVSQKPGRKRSCRGKRNTQQSEEPLGPGKGTQGTEHLATGATASGRRIFTTAADMLKTAILPVCLVQSQCAESLLTLAPFYIPTCVLPKPAIVTRTIFCILHA